MRFALMSMLVLSAASRVSGAEPLEEVWADWATAQAKMTSLVVDYDLETKSSIFQESKRSSYTLRLLRTKSGELLGSLNCTAAPARDEKAKPFGGLLNGGKVYLLDHETKTASRFACDGGELTFLESHFSPFVILVDRKRAEAKYSLELVKQDEWYTYLTVKRKTPKRFGWFPDVFDDGRIAVMRKDSEDIPKGMPRRLWYTESNRDECLFEIKSWRLNPADGPKAEDFTRPEDRPGWKVFKGFGLEEVK